MMLLELTLTSGGLLVGTAIYRIKNDSTIFDSPTWCTLRNNVTNLFSSSERTQQLIKLSSKETREIQEKAEKKINQRIYIALFSTGMAIAGSLIYTPLGLFSLPGIIYINKYIFDSAYQSIIQERQANVDSLSLICNLLLLLGGHLFWCSFSGIIFSVNRKILNTVRVNTKSSLVNVFQQESQTVWVQKNGIEIEIPVSELTTDSIIIVTAGEIIPVDGYIAHGTAIIDQRILTGESQPTEKIVGENVFAATIVLSGKIHIQAVQTAEQTTVAQIGKALHATDDKTQQQMQVEKFSDKTVIPTLATGAMTLSILGPTAALVVIQSHFEHRMTIVSSMGLLNYLNLSSQRDILIKDGSIFEQLQKIDTIVFDKTGTLTEEIPEVCQVHLCANYTENTVLAYAAAAEKKQQHPIAQAIRQAATQRQLEEVCVEQAEYQMGLGLSVTIKKQRVDLGSLRFIQDSGLSLPTSLQTAYTTSSAMGNSMVFLVIANKLIAGIELKPKIRPEAQTTITNLRQHGIQKTYIISGDQQAPTARLAQTLGIDHYFAEVLPEKKAELITQLQQQGHTVCFIGDGINDCIAMKQADVSISLGDASSAATNTAQVILLRNNLSQLSDLFSISTDYLSNTKLAYALVALPSLVSAGGAFLWNFGLLQAMLIPQMGLVLGGLYAIYPLIKK
jgi:Cu2+-exporting ATPase